MLIGQRILIFGGTGSLGYELISRYYDSNTIFNYSRDECKHWQMRLKYPNVNFIIGDVINYDLIDNTINRVKPNIIIFASAMKHIDQCELNSGVSINTNLLGLQNVLNCVEKNTNSFRDYLETVLFVSSDKACSPVNNYGMCKALSETLIIEKAHYVTDFKFINVRYGNVLNSRGSIVPLLHKIGNDPSKEYFTLTHENMTRFVMTLSQSVDLIEHGILYGSSGDTIIPRLVSLNIKELVEIFSEKYNKPIKTTGLRPGEKLLESLINTTQSARIVQISDYTHIRSVFDKYAVQLNVEEMHDYNSSINPFTKSQLRVYLLELNLL